MIKIIVLLMTLTTITACINPMSNFDSAWQRYEECMVSNIEDIGVCDSLLNEVSNITKGEFK